MTAPQHIEDDRIGLMHTWWRGDRLPPLSPVPGLTIAPTDDLSLMNDLMGLSAQELRARFDTGHQAWVGWIGDDPAGYGWVATQHAAIEPLGLTLTFGRDERYLWDFVTRPEWRGHGIYPRIIRQMVDHDPTVDRFWIGHDLPNIASYHGIAKTGFTFCGTLLRLGTTDYRFVASDAPRDRAAAAARLLGVQFDPGSSCG